MSAIYVGQKKRKKNGFDIIDPFGRELYSEIHRLEAFYKTQQNLERQQDTYGKSKFYTKSDNWVWLTTALSLSV